MEVKLNGMRVHCRLTRGGGGGAGAGGGPPPPPPPQHLIRFSLHFTDANLYSWVGRVENKVSKNTTDLN